MEQYGQGENPDRSIKSVLMAQSARKFVIQKGLYWGLHFHLTYPGWPFVILRIIVSGNSVFSQINWKCCLRLCMVYRLAFQITRYLTMKEIFMFRIVGAFDRLLAEFTDSTR